MSESIPRTISPVIDAIFAFQDRYLDVLLEGAGKTEDLLNGHPLGRVQQELVAATKQIYSINRRAIETAEPALDLLAALPLQYLRFASNAARAVSSSADTMDTVVTTPRPVLKEVETAMAD